MQVRGVRKAPELLASHMLTKEKGPKKEKKKSKVVGWSTEKVEAKESKHEFKDTEEMVQWRNINQEEIDNMWKKLSEKIRYKCWKSTKWRRAREEHTKEEVRSRSGGWSRGSKNITLESGVKTAG